MKGYKKGLEKFIEYILKKYSKDKEVKLFKTMYETRKVELQRNKELNKISKPKVKISKETAETCKDLIYFELLKNSMANILNEEYVLKLNKAQEELTEVCLEKIYSKSVLARLKNEQDELS